MKTLAKLLCLLVMFMSLRSFGATCTSISFSNFAANSILTSTALNSAFNTTYNNSNAYDGGCITDGTLEKGSVDTSVATGWAVPLNGIREGCAITRLDANTISIDRCIIAVNGNWVKTTSSTTVTWGANGGSSQTSSADYYVYINTGSTGTTLTPSIKTAVPNGDGYNSSSDRVLGKISNDSAGDLNEAFIEQWINGKLIPTYGAVFTPGISTKLVMYTASIDCDAGSTIPAQYGKTPTNSNWITSIGNISAGDCAITLGTGAFTTVYGCIHGANDGNTAILQTSSIDTTNITLGGDDAVGLDIASFDSFLTCWGTL